MIAHVETIKAVAVICLSPSRSRAMAEHGLDRTLAKKASGCAQGRSPHHLSANAVVFEGLASQVLDPLPAAQDVKRARYQLVLHALDQPDGERANASHNLLAYSCASLALPCTNCTCLCLSFIDLLSF